MLPNTIRPYAGDFFAFEYEGLETHLFRINDVQYDKITPEKYFRCMYALYPYNTEEITGNINNEYTCIYNESPLGANESQVSIIENSSLAAKTAGQNLVDGIIEKYTSLFYNEDSDTFSCHDIYNVNDDGESYFYWSPYLQHFLYETKAMTPYKTEVMSEIYISDISEGEFPAVYNELAYRNSIFRNVQIKNADLDFDSNFICISDYDLKMNRNLPFFMCPFNFKLVTPVVKKGKADLNAYLNAKPILFENTVGFKDVDHYHKAHIIDDLHLSRLKDYLKDGDIFYECKNHELEPTGIYKISMENKLIPSAESVDIREFITKNITNNNEDLVIFNIIKDYLNGTFKLTEALVETLNNRYYKASVENYIFIPIIIYIIKQSLEES